MVTAKVKHQRLLTIIKFDIFLLFWWHNIIRIFCIVRQFMAPGLEFCLMNSFQFNFLLITAIEFFYETFPRRVSIYVHSQSLISTLMKIGLNLSAVTRFSSSTVNLNFTFRFPLYTMFFCQKKEVASFWFQQLG